MDFNRASDAAAAPVADTGLDLNPQGGLDRCSTCSTTYTASTVVVDKAQTQTPPETIGADSDNDDDGGVSDGDNKSNDHGQGNRRDRTMPSSSSVPLRCPWPGSTYIIRSISSGDVLTLHDGEITLAPPPSTSAAQSGGGGGGGSVHWACTETKGWLGFRNVASGKFLGYDGSHGRDKRHGDRDRHGRLICVVSRHQGWEHFTVRPRPQGGFLLLTTHFERLWRVGIRRGVEQQAGRGGGKREGAESGGNAGAGGGILAKIDDGDTAGEEVVWEFIKV
ncbi:uncharacterized protein A1O5_12569 [Cladophialophora psammophila CBS 110553]|uniref:Ricin B lectin domain-containing protein n=1 Tax=Cladophialophora psammophila CBS 110553 TaxID=1182543 RepID=W9VKU3_9EURO|nr:uncharacterized protein A1O5_12569 [Cladophialophora psammophila CBS 110553]EXJ56302.1 hypothetical protein A1O5_12569 [Cladophialophora psammophila CBS 110553]